MDPRLSWSAESCGQFEVGIAAGVAAFVERNQSRCGSALRKRCALQAAMLIPIGIIAYTVTGGLKATFISSYIHTVIIYVVLCLFAFMVYAPSHIVQLGSPGKV